MKHDVVVVGAGPAGSIAALNLANAGVDVLVLEKRQEIGAPKRCAEGINITGLTAVGLTPDPRWAVNRINGAVLYTPAGKSFDISLKEHEGYILERKMFEKHLAAEAIKAGAKYMVKTRAESVIRDGNRITGIRASKMGNPVEISCRLIIGADGVDSKIGKSAGLNTLNKLNDYHSGVQYEMANVKIKENAIHIFFGQNIAPKGYAWIFPKGNTVANVGLGILGSQLKGNESPLTYLDRFIDCRPEFFKDASPIEINTGGIPVSSGSGTFVGDSIMLVGDAAQQVNPIHGGGIAIAMKAAQIAAGVAAEALKDDDLSRDRLFEYEKIWRETEGVKLKKLYKLRGYVEKLDDQDIEMMSTIFTADQVVKLTEGDFGFIPGVLLKKSPKLLFLAQKFLS
ncbi:MAG: NAD(P)/FAD-dependent oxidoreductase [Candidatus Altiarchaeota archaeon]